MMRASTLSVATLALLAIAITGCTEEVEPGRVFLRTDLVSDRAGFATHTDPQLVNPWGIAFGPDTYFWVANNGTSTSTLYDGEGEILSNAIGGPIALPIADPELGVTGMVFHSGEGFVIRAGGPAAPSRFIFATAAGTLIGWSAEVDPQNGVIALDASSTGSRYTGLAIQTSGSRTLLYAADFPNGEVDVYDAEFTPASGLAASAFVDPQLPAGYGPFGIQALEGRIYVTYALRNAAGTEEEPGPGLGIVSVFAADGAFVTRIASGGVLNAPWGLTRAPAEFGRYDNALLVGNFGDGRITAIDSQTLEILGQLESDIGVPIEIDGLWALTFGNGRLAGEPDDLYFTAGPDEETHGVFGEITAIK